MIEFKWSDVFAILTPATVLMSAILGLAMGYLLNSFRQHPPAAHLYWMLMGGVVFFIPLALVRMLEGSDIWEHLAGMYVLWSVYVFAMMIGSRLTARRS